MSWMTVEFAVQMRCGACVEALDKALGPICEVRNVRIDPAKNSVVLETTLSTQEVQNILQKTGRKVVVKGYEGELAAVSVVEEGPAQGVVRFVQNTRNSCIVDGTIDGVRPNLTYKIDVHQSGDLTGGCTTVGDVFQDIGLVKSGPEGRMSFRLEQQMSLSEAIGRSFCVKTHPQNTLLACGIVARSAGLFQNPKTICACDGVSIWDEKK